MKLYNELHEILLCEQNILDACDVNEIDQRIASLRENCERYCRDATQTINQKIHSIRCTLESLKNVKRAVIDHHLLKTQRRHSRSFAILTDVLTNQNMVIGTINNILDNEVYKRIDIPNLFGRQSTDVLNQIQQWFQSMAAIMFNTIKFIDNNIRPNLHSQVFSMNHLVNEVYDAIKIEIQSLVQSSFVVVEQPPEMIMRASAGEKKQK